MEKLNYTHIKSLGGLNCSEVFLRGGETDIIPMTLKEAEKKYNGLRLHKCTVVNPDAIRDVDVDESGAVYLVFGKHRVKVARSKVGVLYKHITGKDPKYKRKEIIKKHYGFAFESEL